MNDQLSYMNNELKTITAHFHTTIESETENHLAAISATTKNLAANSGRSFRDVLLGSNPVPFNTDPRILTREGIKARQILFDFPADSSTREFSQNDILRSSTKL